MDVAVRVELPTDLAETLLADEDAVPPFFDTRNAGAADIVTILLDGVNTGAEVVTLIVTVNACRKIAKRYWRKIRESGQRQVTIQIIRKDGTDREEIKVGVDDVGAEDRLLEFLVQSLERDA
jgi:hypothetical protein